MSYCYRRLLGDRPTLWIDGIKFTHDGTLVGSRFS